MTCQPLMVSLFAEVPHEFFFQNLVINGSKLFSNISIWTLSSWTYSIHGLDCQMKQIKHPVASWWVVMFDLFRGRAVRQQEILFSFLPEQYSLFSCCPRHSYRQAVHSRAQPLHALPVRPANVSPTLTLHCGGIPLWVNLIPTFRLCHALFILSVSLIVIDLHLCIFISPSFAINLHLSLPPLFFFFPW